MKIFAGFRSRWTMPAACAAERLLEQLARQRVDLLRREAVKPLHAGVERLAVEELHDHEALAPGQLADVEHLEDVVVAYFAGGLRLPLEPTHHVGVARHRRVQHLDRDPAVEAQVLPREDRAHPTLADEGDDPVLAVDDLSDFDAHSGPGQSLNLAYGRALSRCEPHVFSHPARARGHRGAASSPCSIARSASSAARSRPTVATARVACRPCGRRRTRPASHGGLPETSMRSHDSA